MKALKSPLRYPGGKSKAIAKILQYIPSDFAEYREPFVGGGSVFIDLKQRYPQLKVWINDLNVDLFCFWKCAQFNMDELVQAIWQIKHSDVAGKALFVELTTLNVEQLSEFERAVRFFVLNRISFSGTVDCGGFSQKAFETRFTNSSIKRLHQLKALLSDIVITNYDYSEVLEKPGNEVFIFLDPPYFAATKSKLYGKKGDLHTGFDHAQFARKLQTCPHQWLITYDDSAVIRENFSFANLYEWQLQYGMNNYMQGSAAKGRELFITNYNVEPESVEQPSCSLSGSC
jgi:DNA adenine methylase